MGDHSTAAERFRAAVEARDLEGVAATLAPEVVFHSPVAFRPFVGAESVAAVLRGVGETFVDFRYLAEMPGEEVHGLLFRARVGDREVNGIDLIKGDETGRVAELTVMLRPLSAIQAMGEAMAAKVEGLAKA